MKRLIPFLFLFAIAPQARADIRHAITSSAQLTVGAASTTTTRIPSTYSVSGTGVDTAIGDNAGQLSAGTITSGVYSPGTVVGTQNATSGESFSFPPEPRLYSQEIIIRQTINLLSTTQALVGLSTLINPM